MSKDKKKSKKKEQVSKTYKGPRRSPTKAQRRG